MQEVPVEEVDAPLADQAAVVPEAVEGEGAAPVKQSMAAPPSKQKAVMPPPQFKRPADKQPSSEQEDAVRGEHLAFCKTEVLLRAQQHGSS